MPPSASSFMLLMARLSSSWEGGRGEGGGREGGGGRRGGGEGGGK